MYRYRVFRPKGLFWIENEREIRALAEDVDKAVGIAADRWSALGPYHIYPIEVGGGCRERDTGYEMFGGGSYPIFDSVENRPWADRLIEDFRKEEKEKLDGGWFSVLSFETVRVLIVGRPGPVLLHFRRGTMTVTVCCDEKYKDEERALLAEFEREFGLA